MTDIPPLVHLARELTLARQWADRVQFDIDAEETRPIAQMRIDIFLARLDTLEAAIVEARKVL